MMRKLIDAKTPSSSYQELTLLSLATSDMGTFRLLVHAGYLLDRVIHLVSDQDIKGETFTARREQLYRTMTALMSLLEVEEECSIASVRVARNVLNRYILPSSPWFCQNAKELPAPYLYCFPSKTPTILGLGRYMTPNTHSIYLPERCGVGIGCT